MSKPIVSVIVTTYNRKKYLKETIQSILNQTFSDFELIVVDNFSNYDFYQVIKEFNDLRIKPYQNKNGGIIAVNRNYGISKASGKYLAFCDDDDLWHKDKLRIQLSYIQDRGKVVIGSSFFLIDSNGSIKRKQVRKTFRNKKKWYLENNIMFSSALLPKSEDIVFETNEMYFGIEDYALWLTLLHKDYDFIVCPETLLYYRVASTNNSNNLKKKRPFQRLSFLCSIMLRYPHASISYFCLALIVELFWLIFYNKIKK